MSHAHPVSWFRRDPGGSTIYVRPETPDPWLVGALSSDDAMPWVDHDLWERVRLRGGARLREATNRHDPGDPSLAFRRMYLNARTSGVSAGHSK